MVEILSRTAHSVKSLVGLSFAYEIAAAGRIALAIGVSAIGMLPWLWWYTKRFVDCPTNFYEGPHDSLDLR